MDKSLKVLIAEDEFLVLKGLEVYLKELGHEVIATAGNGKDAVEKTLELNPDIIIMDINMPVMSGLDAIEKINSVKRRPCIIISAYHDKELIERASDEGVLYYLIKPITLQDLRAAIEIAVSRYKEWKDLTRELNTTKVKLEDRKYIEKAKGILMKKMNIDEQEAMKSLQKISKDKNIKLADLSKEIIKADKK